MHNKTAKNGDAVNSDLMLVSKNSTKVVKNDKVPYVHPAVIAAQPKVAYISL